ncbi:MAG: L-arabinose isomerase [Gemmatimonadales bacterium]|nr:L-arabinose isomerase [Gemmatimonadales bacterium]NIN12921.1 L-arabinose isomerase [Gemmatimonadales bacterium]NIR02209.1 L-arabinose isomerase [Gemmatimonadales bacterium]NIS66001.1 L-arabinose isomerase [Gemmatimonadales bacterium]
MINLRQYELWFVTGSQHLYGDDLLRQVDDHARQIAESLDRADSIPVKVVAQPVQTTPDAIRQVCTAANAAADCVGILLWMHTFSPAKMWIGGLNTLHKPFLHLHTQFNRDIPWSTIDMDFMNLNQSAHGDREFGYLCTRMGLARKVVVGHWRDSEVVAEIARWSRAACAWHDAQGARIARFGDNMRDVAVTEGDKVEAEMRFGYAVKGYGLGDLAACIDGVDDAAVDGLAKEYDEQYDVVAALRPSGARRASLKDAARIELGLRAFLEDGGFTAFTDTFENLHGLRQLPGIAVQRLMADGYGFGAEGDWKTAALVRAMKVMASGLAGGTSFMEDYTYHLHPEGMKVLGAHMLEICPSIAGSAKPSLEIHPLSIGGKEDPVRLVFDARSGPAVNAALIDLGDRFRVVVNEVEVVPSDEELPKLPVARAVWLPRPDLRTAAAAWILAGGAHHTGFSQALTAAQLEDFAEITGVELLTIGDTTSLAKFKKELRCNESYYGRAGRR